MQEKDEDDVKVAIKRLHVHLMVITLQIISRQVAPTYLPPSRSGI